MFPFPAGVMVAFSQTTLTVMETTPPVTMCVQLTGELEIAITAAVSFEDNSATSDDHGNTNITFTFTSGSSDPQCLQLTLIEDGLLENEELFTISLSSPDIEVDVVNGSVVVTLQDSSELSVGFQSAPDVITEGEVLMACVNISSGQLAGSFSLALRVEVSTGQGTV